MDPATTTAQLHFFNIESLFVGIYNLLFVHIGVGNAAHANIGATLANLWGFVSVLSYIACFGLLIAFAYATVSLNESKEKDHHMHDTIEPEEAERETGNARWRHVESLIEGMNESDWRQAIIEADIMLNDILGLHGYEGDTVGEKLKQGDPTQFLTLQDAWEAHKVRNEIAHAGSAYPLSNQIAYRTITRYKNVFEEFHAI